MDSARFFADMMRKRQNGQHAGIFSVCSSSGLVLEATFGCMKGTGYPVLIESTANQVNQFGGYTGMKPADFRHYVENIAYQCGFPAENIMLGGDHLGPLTWKDKPEAEAMPLAQQLVADYVRAGFDKIHLDTSMKLADDDPDAPLADDVIARRGAQLCAVAEKAHAECAAAGTRQSPPVYVIGSEVPVPGGPQHEIDTLSPTSPDACRASIAAFRAAFAAEGITGAWQRVVAFVVQPGVEFTGTEVFYYDSPAAAKLLAVLREEPGLVFEGHSTDYQTGACLYQMVADGIAILKVGPALTHAQREALWALEETEKALRTGSTFLSGYMAANEHAMLSEPSQWSNHYHGAPLEQAFLRQFSFHDRARYYSGTPEVVQGTARLFENLEGVKIPLPVISRFFPLQFPRVQQGLVEPYAPALVQDYIACRLSDYVKAAGLQDPL